MTTPLTLSINGQDYEVGDVTPDTRLFALLEEHRLVGTKSTCFRGACGACVVVAEVTDPATGEKRSMTINSCLVPVLACVGWKLTTIEGLGNKYDGYHVIQDKLVEKSGTQCGYCSPGMVMSMYGLTQDKDQWTDEDVERQLDGSMCRCTGYRPILEAFKSITPQDIEDANKETCPSTGKSCSGCGSKKDKKKGSPVRTLQLRDTTWHNPTSLQELLDTLGGFADGTQYTLICGNTAQALYGGGSPSEYIYVGGVPELCVANLSTESLVFGGNISITRLIEQLSIAAQDIAGFSYVSQLVDMWNNLGNTAVRNLGTLAGNLATKVNNPDFTSDIFVGLAGAGATITTVGVDGTTTQYTMEELLQVDLVGGRQVIQELSLTPLSDDVVFRTFKVGPRATTTLADINAAFNIRVDTSTAHTVVGTPTIVYGGVSPSFVHASAAETALAGKSLEDEGVVQAALTALASEVDTSEQPGRTSPVYRKALTQTILYKTILGIVGETAGSSVQGGSTDLKRPVSSGTQTIPENKEKWPIGEPVTKFEGPIQCSGEAEYVKQLPSFPGELFGIFVTSTECNAKLVSIDTTAAMAIPGVVDFVAAKDIPGVNNILSYDAAFTPDADQQPVFATDRVGYVGQPIGLLVATDRGAAYAGKYAVKVTYEDQQPPIITIQQGLENTVPPHQFPPLVIGDVSAGFANSTHTVEGSMEIGGQFHYHMETQVTIVNPTDNGYDIHISSQWLSETQRVIGQVLNIPDNQVFCSAKRLGGAFGAKISQSNMVSSAAAVAAHKTRRPVRLELDLTDNMTIIGGREPARCSYKVGVDDDGLLQAVQATLTCNAGYLGVDVSAPGIVESIMSSYSCANWDLTAQYILSNTPITTWCRTPGTLQGISFMENIMDHLAVELGVDPLKLRQKNFIPDNTVRRINKLCISVRSRIAGQEKLNLPNEIKVPRNLLNDMITQMMNSADVETRKAEVAQFNQDNKWKKRGLSMMPMMWPFGMVPVIPFSVMVSVNSRDGSVAISHGGMEMGQGINTKVAQVAAYELKIPMDTINFIASNVHTNPNSSTTSGSTGSDVCCYSVGEACRRLRARLDQYQEDAGLDNPTWQELIISAFIAGVDISERYVNGVDEVKGYTVFGVACTEVELDVLTGQFIVTRADILEDAGISLSPLVDIGQIEGGFVMGQGLFTVEKVAFDSTTGKRLTDSVWTYHTPYDKDIPADLRVSLLQDAPNPVGVQSSKVTAEPPLCLSYSVVMALRQAVTSAREDAGTTGWVQMDAPLTYESLQQLCLVDTARLTLS